MPLKLPFQFHNNTHLYPPNPQLIPPPSTNFSQFHLPTTQFTDHLIPNYVLINFQRDDFTNYNSFPLTFFTSSAFLYYPHCQLHDSKKVALIFTRRTSAFHSANMSSPSPSSNFFFDTILTVILALTSTATSF